MPQTLVLEAIPFALAGTLTTLSANTDPSVRASLPVCPAQTLAWPSFEPALDQRQPQGADTMSSSECRGSRDPNGKGLPMWPAFDERKSANLAHLSRVRALRPTMGSGTASKFKRLPTLGTVHRRFRRRCSVHAR